MTKKTLKELSDDELEALSVEELLRNLDPSLANGLKDIWNRTGSLSGDWAQELIADRREQVSREQTQAQ